MPGNEWYREVEPELDRQAERAKAISRSFLRVIPFSVVIGLAVCVIIVTFWGWREFSRMILQVMLTLTIGATLFAGWLRRIDARVNELDEKA